MLSLYYQKSPDKEGFEVIVLDFIDGQEKVVWNGLVSEVTQNDR